MAENISDSEQQYFNAVAEEAAQEHVKQKQGKSEAEVETLINEIGTKEKIHDDLKFRFRLHVLKRAAEMEEKAREEKEKHIINKFKGKVEEIDGKFHFVGVQQKFNVKVRVGNLVQRMWSKSFDAQKLDQTLREVDDLETQIEEKKAELEILKAARDATSNVLGLTRDIFRSKREAQGTWGVIFSKELNLWESYKAASELKAAHKKEYEEKGKAKFKELEEQAKQLERKQKVLHAALEKIEKMRESNRGIFERTFGPELRAIMANRDAMTDEEYNKKIEALRSKVNVFGKNAGIVGLEYFLNEDLGIKPNEVLKKTITVVYREPMSAVEKGRERASVSRWWETVFRKKATENEVTETIAELRKHNPDYLVKIEKEETDKYTMAALHFLFTGKNSDSREILSEQRRAKPFNPENVVKYLKMAKAIAKHGDKIEDAMNKFADNWPEDYTADDFEHVVDVIVRGIEGPNIRAARLKKLAPLWEELTGQKMEDAGEAAEFYDEIEKECGAAMGPNVFMEKLINISREEKNFINFFFTGRYADTSYQTDKGKCIPVLAASVMTVYKFAHGLFQDKPTREELKSVCAKIFSEKDEGTDNLIVSDGNLLNVSETILHDLLTKVRTPKKKK